MSILEAFDYYFEMIPVTSDELRQEVYKLRYQVYCLEKSFEDPDIHPDGLEYDEYDPYSCHYLIRHRESQSYMATTRLVLPDIKNPDRLFPVEIHSYIDNFEALKNIRRIHLAELSRFCVSKHFRRRANERDFIITNDAAEDRFSRREKGSSPNLTLALFASAIRMSSEHNILYWYAIMEPALKRVFSALGIQFIEIGPIVDYHGMRVPCVIKVADLLHSVAEKDLDYWNMLTNRGEY